MSEYKHGELNATTGRSYPPPLTDGHEMPHIEDLIADGRMTERARTVALVAARLWGPCGEYETIAEAMHDAADIVTRADEWDRHERLK